MFGDRDKELLISHDELMVVCRTQMEILLRAGLQTKLSHKLSESGVLPGFADRAEEVQKKFHRERLQLMASGEIR
jgi:hypothetical protein